MKTTKRIELEIEEKKDYEFSNENYASPSEIINGLLSEKKIKKSEIINGLNLDINNAYKYLDGSRIISRDLFLAILIYLHLNIEEVQLLLKQSFYKQLYVRHERDYIIYQGIVHQKTLLQINENIVRNKLKPIYTSI